MAASTGRPRVLVLTPWYPSAERPLEAPFNARHVGAIAQHAEVRVIHLRLGASGPPRTDTVEGRTVERLPFGPRHPLTALRTLARIARCARGADIVHTMAFSAILVAAPIRAALPRVWVHTEHWSAFAAGGGHGVWERRARLLRRALRLPTVVTAVSAELARALAGDARRVEIVPNVIDADAAPAAFPAKPPLRLIAVGGLIDRKQPLMAVRTLAWLVKQGTDASLEFVGDGELRGAVLAEAARLGVGHRVTLAGSVAPAEVPTHLTAAHVYFLPTLSETFLVGGAEAIAAGRPVVLGGRGGFTDYVAPGNGVVVTEHTPRAYGRAVLDVHAHLTDPAAIAATIERRFSTATIGARFAELYTGLMVRHGAD